MDYIIFLRGLQPMYGRKQLKNGIYCGKIQVR